MIYADHAATTPLSPAALAAMLSCLSVAGNGIPNFENALCANVFSILPKSEDIRFGNPSSLHTAGRASAEVLREARVSIASAIGAHPDEIIFTSGGTEADNQAIRTIEKIGESTGRRHILVSPLEHSAMRKPLKSLSDKGFSVEMLPVEPDGRVLPTAIAARLRPDTVAVVVLYASNEIGTIQPIPEIGAVCRQAGALLVCDAVQAVGHLPLDVRADNIDLLTISAHKLYGPQGVGALYARSGLRPTPLLLGGEQEAGRRAGSKNIMSIHGFSAALAESVTRMERDSALLRSLSARLIDGLLGIPGTRLNGSREHRLPGHVSVSFADISAEGLLCLLDSRGICASAGAACAAGELAPSPALLALGLTPALALGTIRFTLGRDTTAEEVETIIRVTAELVGRLRG